MKIERYTGQSEMSGEPGEVEFHATFTTEKMTPFGVRFFAKPDATEGELQRLAQAEYGRRTAKPGTQ